MTITVTVTDPTQDEARLLSDYFAAIERSHIDETPASVAPLRVNQHIPADYVERLHDTIAAPLPPVTEQEDEAFASIDTAAIFGTGAGVALPPVAQEERVAPGVTADAAGMPWDGRIHASTRSTVAGGVWRLKKGVDEALVASVTAELRAAMAAPAAIAPPPAAPVVAPPPAPGITVAPPPPASGAMTFPQLMLRITSMTPGAETQARVTQAVQSAGLPSLPMLASRPDLVPAVAAALGVA